MNIFEENRALLFAKLNQDKAEYFNSPVIKSKTPVPNKLSKETLKSKKQIMKKIHGKNEKMIGKSNTNTCSNYFKRTKNKGSVSVELFNGTKEMQRPLSAISKSFINHLELAQKVKGIKKYSGQINIEKIIKQSLLKAKSNKINKEKDQKHNLIQNEIRKQELKFHNNQIRIQNSTKPKKKPRKRSKKSPIGKYGDLIQKNCKSESMPSYPRDFLNKVQLMYSKDYPKTDSNKFDHYILKKDSKDSMDELSDIQANDLSFDSDKAKHYSFIRTDDQIHKSHQKESHSGDGQLSRSLDLSIQRNEIMQQDQEEPSFFNPSKINQKKTQSLSFQTQTSLKITKVPVHLATQSFSLHLPSNPPPKPVLNLNRQPSTSIPASKPSLICKSQKIFSCSTLLSSSNTSSSSLKPSSTSQIQKLSEQVSEEISNSLSHLFLIDQLKLFELSTLSDISKLIPSDLHTSLTFQIEKKFSALVSFIQPEIEQRTKVFVASLNKAQSSEFLSKTQKKKQGFHAFFNDLRTSQEFKLRVRGKEEEQSGSSSSSDERTQGISHSRSVARLHEGLMEASEPNNTEIDFGYKETQPEPIVPVLKIDLKPVENEVSETRRLLSNEVSLKFAEKVLFILQPSKILTHLKAPLEKDPLVELDKIQDLQIGTFTENDFWKFDMIVESDEVNKLEIFDYYSEYRDLETIKVEKVFRRMVVECINFLLQQFRPFGVKGKPLPWEMREVRARMKDKSWHEIVGKVLQDFKYLNEFCIGKHEEIDSLVFNDENAILKYKERQLDKVIYNEIFVEEEKWLDYGFEEAQVKIDLADVILYELVTEVININE